LGVVAKKLFLVFLTSHGGRLGRQALLVVAAQLGATQKP